MDDGITCIYNGDNIVKIIFPKGKEKITKADLPANLAFVKEVVLPPSVKEIGEYAFADSGLEKINLENVEKIGNSAFNGCKSLKEIVLPPSVKEIGKQAFAHSGLEKISLKNIEKIGNYAFYRCENLKEVELSSVKEIGEDAFGNSGLEKINLENVEKIGNYAFYNCENLKEVELSSVKEIGEEAFLLSSLEKINLENVEKIGNSAFYRCESLKEIVLPPSVKEIGEEAFADSGLEKISLKNIEKIGDCAFNRCKNLKEAALSSVKEIGEDAFKNAGLEKISLENVEKIGTSAFIGCKSLKEIVLPSVKEIRNYAFADSGLEKINLENVEKIGDHAFIGCKNLKEAALSSVKEIGEEAFENSGLEKINLENVEKIGDFAFYKCENLKEAELSSVKEIGEYAFADPGLEKINLENVEKIGNSAFYRCESLKEIVLPPSVKEIGKQAFAHSGLEKISLENVEKIGNYAFYRCENLKEAELSSVIEIGEYAFEDSGLEKINLENIEIIGESAFNRCESLKEVILPSVKEIRNYAFAHSGLEKVSLENIEKIGHCAFNRCESLKEAKLFSVKEIGEYAFADSGLEKINLENVEKIGGYAFNGCESLKEIVLPPSVKEIGNYAFADSGLEKINLENVEKIGESAFNWSGIKKIVIPDGVEVSVQDKEQARVHNGVLYYFTEISNKISQACGLNTFGDHTKLNFMTEKYAILKGMTFDKMFDELCRGEHVSFLKFMGDTVHRNPSNEQIEKMVDDFFLGASVFKNKTYQESSIDHAKEAFKEKFHGHYPKIIETIALYADHNVYTIEDIVNKFNVSDMKNIIDKTDTWGEALTCMMSTDKSERASFLNNPYQSVITKLYVDAATLSEDERERVHAAAKWVMSHKSASNKLINDIEKYGRYLNINETSTVVEINTQINNTLGLFEMQNIEKDYRDVNFSFNDLQYNLKHSSVTVEDRTARTLQKGEEALMVRLGYLTSCCQHLNGAGETAMMHGLINPNAGFWVIEDEKGQVIAQAEIWEKDKDTIIFDNIEFANDRELKDIQKVLTSWVESSQYKNVIMGCGYNELSSSISLQKSEAQYPELTAEEIYMLQDEDEYDISMEDAKYMAESGDYDYDDFVYTDADEHCVFLKKNGVVDSALYGNWGDEGREDYDDIGDDEEIGG